jgi:hypothetical protein
MENIMLTRVCLRGLLFILAIYSSLGSVAGQSLSQKVNQEDISKFGSSDKISSGVNIHFTTGHEKDLDMIAAAGIKFIRMDFVWQNTEHTKGIYDCSAYDELTTNLKNRGLRALYILDYSNSLYEPEVGSKDPVTGEAQKGIAAPCHPESVEALETAI